MNLLTVGPICAKNKAFSNSVLNIWAPRASTSRAAPPTWCIQESSLSSPLRAWGKETTSQLKIGHDETLVALQVTRTSNIDNSCVAQSVSGFAHSRSSSKACCSALSAF